MCSFLNDRRFDGGAAEHYRFQESGRAFYRNQRLRQMRKYKMRETISVSVGDGGPKSSGARAS
jgi:hypothetical protein